MSEAADKERKKAVEELMIEMRQETVQAAFDDRDIADWLGVAALLAVHIAPKYGMTASELVAAYKGTFDRKRIAA